MAQPPSTARWTRYIYIGKQKALDTYVASSAFLDWLALTLGSHWPALSRIALRAKIFVGIASSEW